jgi:putative methanogenesis marker protein 6
MIVIAPSSELTPDQIARFIHSLGLTINIKETCYGANIEGPKEQVRTALREVRKLDPNRIFSKIRAFPIGDERKCRAHHGSRPGFNQVEKEWRDLAMIDVGLCAADRGEVCEPRPKPKPLPLDKLQEIVDEVKR